MSSVAKRSDANLKDDQSARDKILDAAERLFAEHGFYGSTTREIAKQAGVPLGLMAYYFKTKSDLYSEVIMRRSEEHAWAIQASLDAAMDRAGDEPVSVGDLVKAWFRPLVERSLWSGPGWKSYIQLMAQAANTPRREPYVEAFTEVYSPVMHQFIALLKDRFPEAEEENIYWAYHLFTSSIPHILVESGLIDKLSGGACKSSDLEMIMEKMGPFFEAGISRLAES